MNPEKSHYTEELSDIDFAWNMDDAPPFRGGQETSSSDNFEISLSAAEFQNLTAQRATETALSALESVASTDVVEQYQKQLLELPDLSYAELKPIVKEINQIVKADWIGKMTDLENYQIGDSYHFICQSIHEPYRASEYLGNYASCSLLTDQIHNTYSTGFGFIYAPEDIVAAGGSDLNLENRATSDDDVMRLQSIPTIDSIENILRQQEARMLADPANARRQYNEVGVKAGHPIGIFCISNREDENDPLSNYSRALKLQELNPTLKLAILPKTANVTKENALPSINFDELDDDELVW